MSPGLHGAQTRSIRPHNPFRGDTERGSPGPSAAHRGAGTVPGGAQRGALADKGTPPGPPPEPGSTGGAGGRESVCSVPLPHSPTAAAVRGLPGCSFPHPHCGLGASQVWFGGDPRPISSHHCHTPPRRGAGCPRGIGGATPAAGGSGAFLSAQPPLPRLPTPQGASPNDFSTEGDACIKGFTTSTRNRRL